MGWHFLHYYITYITYIMVTFVQQYNNLNLVQLPGFNRKEIQVRSRPKVLRWISSLISEMIHLRQQKLINSCNEGEVVLSALQTGFTCFCGFLYTWNMEFPKEHRYTSEARESTFTSLSTNYQQCQKELENQPLPLSCN